MKKGLKEKNTYFRFRMAYAIPILTTALRKVKV